MALYKFSIIITIIIIIIIISFTNAKASAMSKLPTLVIHFYVINTQNRSLYPS